MTVLPVYNTADKLFCSELDPSFWKTKTQNKTFTIYNDPLYYQWISLFYSLVFSIFVLFILVYPIDVQVFLE